jgi:phosphoribosyl-AMP cyclohydrolase
MEKLRQILTTVIIFLLLFSATAYSDIWTKSKRLTWNKGESLYPVIAVDGQDIYVVWEDYTPGNAEIYFKNSNDRGATWTKSKRLTWNKGDSYDPAIAVDGQDIYVVWANFIQTPANYEIYFKKGVLF